MRTNGTNAQLPVEFRHARKKNVLDSCITALDQHHIDYACLTLLQLVFSTKARVHVIHLHVENAVIAAIQALSSNHGDVIQVIEVPTKMTVCKFYTDMDLHGNRVKCFAEMGDHEVITRVREIGLRTPEVLTGILEHLCFIQKGQLVSVVNVEGTRFQQGKKCIKYSWHFIWNLLLTRNQYIQVWSEIFAWMQSGGDGIGGLVGDTRVVSAFIMDDTAHITPDVLKAAGDYACLLMLDPHVMRNPDQGLKTPWSRSAASDPPLRPMQIMWVRGCVHEFSEIPDKRIWTAHLPIMKRRDELRHLDPIKASWAMSRAMLAPSPGCIGCSKGPSSNGCPNAEGVIGARLSHASGSSAATIASSQVSLAINLYESIDLYESIYIHAFRLALIIRYCICVSFFAVL